MAEAITEYRLALAADPGNRGVRFNLALAYYKTADLAHAIQELETVRKGAPPNDSEAHRAAVLLGECYLRQGNDKQVIAILDPVAASDPNDLAVAYLLGTALIREKEPDRGTVIIERILRT